MVWAFLVRSSQEAILFNAHPAIIVGENFFCVYFTLEIIIRFMAFQRKLNAFKDFWLLGLKAAPQMFSK